MNNSEAYKQAMQTLDEYLDYQRGRGRKESSLICYRSAIKKLITFIEDRGGDPRPGRITGHDITIFVNEYLASESTKRYYLSVAAEWLKHYGYNTIEEIGLLWNKCERPNARWAGEDQLNKMLKAATDPADRLILILAAFGGLRRGEISAIKETDVLADKIIIHGKGHGRTGKIRRIPKSKLLSDEIEIYRRYKAEVLKESKDQSDGYLICTMTGHAYRHATPETVGKHARTVAISAGYDLTTHSLRRYFATALYDQGVDTLTIKELMGHESARMTEKYIKRPDQILKSAIEMLAHSQA